MEPISIRNFRGKFSQGNDESIPLEFMRVAKNVIFKENQVRTRPRTKQYLTNLPIGLADTVLCYRRVEFSFDNSVRYLVLIQRSIGGYYLQEHYNGNNTILGGTSLSTGSGAAELKVVMMFDRCYVSTLKPTGTPATHSSVGPDEVINVGVYNVGSVTAISLVSGGAGYAVGDILSIDDSTGQFATIEVTAVAAGVITTATLETGGEKYTTGSKATTAITGAGTGAVFSVTTVGPTYRDIAGAAPSGFTLGAAISATAGTVEVGRHLFAVAYETDSGYITVPGPTSWTLHNQTTANRKVDISSIPIGPTGTVARHILASRVIFNYNSKNFNQLEHELFFIPNGRIGDNTRTTFSVDFIDSQLQSSADYLIDQLEQVKVGPGLTDYVGSLVVAGEIGAEYVARISKPGAPESFDSVSGFCTVGPDDGGGRINAAIEERGVLYLFKHDRTYGTQNTGLDPSEWPVNLIDGSTGCWYDGISKVLDSRFQSTGTMLVAHRSGLRLFNGGYSEILVDQNIHQDWDNAEDFAEPTVAAAGGVQVAIDPIKRRIYVKWINSSSDETPVIKCGDYSKGLDPQLIRWSDFYFPISPGHFNFEFISADKTYNLSFNTFHAHDANTYYIVDEDIDSTFGDANASGDNQVAIDTDIEFGPLQFSGEEGLSTFTKIKQLSKGNGNQTITLTDRNGGNSVSPPTIALTSSFIPRVMPINYNQFAMYLRMRTNALAAYMILNKLFVYGEQTFEELPR